MLKISDITPSPWQPREKFRQEDLADLIRSIRLHGLLQPVVVREKAGYRSALVPRYELMAGGRRLEAATRAGLDQVPAHRLQVDDAGARALVWEENHQRRDLNPIEKGRMLKSMLDAGDAAGPTELAEKIGVSQSEVSNLLRMLELPKEWQARVAAGEIPPTYARGVLPWREEPAVLSAIAKKIGKGDVAARLSRDEFEERIRWTIDEISVPLSGTAYHRGSCCYVPVFEPTEEQRARLGVIQAKPRRHNGKPEPRALNRKLWNELQAAHAKEWVKKEQARKKTRGKPKKGEKPARLSKAELKRQAEEERRRRQQLAQQLEQQIGRLKANWYRWLISREIDRQVSDGRPAPLTLLRLLAFVVGAPRLYDGYSWEQQRRIHDRALILADVLQAAGGTPRYHKSNWGSNKLLDGWAAAAGLDMLHIAQFVRALFWAGDRPSSQIRACYLEPIAAYLGIDPAACWAARSENGETYEQMGPVTEAFWDAFNKAQLVELGKEIKVHVEESKPKSVAVKLLVSAPRSLPMPKRLKRAKLMD